MGFDKLSQSGGEGQITITPSSVSVRLSRHQLTKSPRHRELFAPPG